ncbi:hypothetical protein [Leptospira noguchii]|uniref:Uncharacterized protein n=1 Tax=Leptospira noguchii TaxID=28182 RepID=A0AAE9GGC6_9LEPT|nr:hypothetical protein [Leptospira noguchii]UOG57026.1 hypothetical protein MAL03_02075 [Leptospira noguchii]
MLRSVESHNQPHKLNRIFRIKIELSKTLSYESRWKLNTTLSMDRVGNSTQRSLWIAFETQHNALYGSRLKLNTTLSMDRV